jgi:p-methyltransferase
VKQARVAMPKEMASDIDVILIAQSECIDYSKYLGLPLDRIAEYRNLVYPRMLYHKGGFHAHLDILNYCKFGKYYQDADFAERRQLYNIWNLPSFSGIHLANYLVQYGIRPFIINNIDSEWDILEKLYEAGGGPVLIALSCTFYLSFNEIKRITKILRRRFPNSEIVIGGAFLNQFFINDKLAELEAGMRRLGIAYALHSYNSEQDLKDLVLHKTKRASGISLSDVKNLVYFENDEFKVNAAQWHDPVLQGVPVHWDQLNLSFINQTIQLRVSSGCQFNCSFCSYPVTTRGFHPADLGAFEADLKLMLRQSSATRIIFIDDTFNVPKERFKKICTHLAKMNVAWYSFLRVQFVDEETVKLMKDSGCAMVYLGIESANDAILSNMNKKATRCEFERGVRLLKKHDIPMLAGFVIGFPGETEQTARENIDFIENNGVDFYSLKEFYYMKHTPIYESRDRYELKGIGANWEHKTMNYLQASDLKLAMFREIKGSIGVDPDTSMWYIAYLNDQGYSMAQVKDLQRAINAVILEQLDGRFDDDHPAFNKITNIVKRVAS